MKNELFIVLAGNSLSIELMKKYLLEYWYLLILPIGYIIASGIIFKKKIAPSNTKSRNLHYSLIVVIIVIAILHAGNAIDKNEFGRFFLATIALDLLMTSGMKISEINLGGVGGAKLKYDDIPMKGAKKYKELDSVDLDVFKRISCIFADPVKVSNLKNRKFSYCKEFNHIVDYFFSLISVRAAVYSELYKQTEDSVNNSLSSINDLSKLNKKEILDLRTDLFKESGFFQNYKKRNKFIYIMSTPIMHAKPNEKLLIIINSENEISEADLRKLPVYLYSFEREISASSK